MRRCSMATSPPWTRAEVPELSQRSMALGDAAESRIARSAAVTEHWSIRLRDLLSTYLPLLLMLALAALTWWLVRITPVPSATRPAEPLSQAPDYILGEVELVRYRGDGSLLARVRAREVRHYPVGDRVDLEGAWLLADHPEGAVLAQAEQAVLTNDGQRVRLQGDVRFSREASASQAAFNARTSVLELDLQAGRAWTLEPVQWRQGDLWVQAAGFEYEQSGSRLELKGPLKAQMAAQTASQNRAPPQSGR